MKACLDLAIPGHQLYELAAPVDADHAHILLHARQLQDPSPGAWPCEKDQISMWIFLPQTASHTAALCQGSSGHQTHSFMLLTPI